MKTPKSTEESMTCTVPQVRPWVRYFARQFDYFLFAFAFSFTSVIIIPSFSGLPDIVLGMLILFFWIFVEAALLASWGTTPGKWLLKRIVRTSNNQKLTFSGALSRSFSVWLTGLGAGFPIVTFITLVVAHTKLTKDRITTWDRKGGFVVSHNKIGVLRVIITVLFFVGFFVLSAWSSIAE